MSERTIRVGLLGCGTVGTSVVRTLHEHADDIERRAGVRVVVTRVAVRDVAKDRDVPLAAGTFTTDGIAIVDDPDVDVIVELLGGIEPARSLIAKALASGKPVVTANKELLARHGRELFAAAGASGLDLRFEAAVAGGVPLIRPLQESLAGERVDRILGIVNGTTNYILTQMSERGWGFDEALAEAQRLGYAEADPTADVEGFDAAAKCAILATLAFDTDVTADDVHREGITQVTAQDIADADRLGYVVKLLAIAELEDGEVSARVHPAMVPVAHPLASVREAFNAVFVEGAKVGQLMFYGRGAGGDPTATSVVGDVVHVARHLAHAHAGMVPQAGLGRRLRPMGETRGPVLPEPPRPGSARRPRRDRRVLRPALGLDRARLAGRCRRRGDPRVHHPPGARGRLPGDPR